MRAIFAMAALATAGAFTAPAVAADIADIADVSTGLSADGAFAALPVSDDLLGRIAGREDVAQIAQADQAATVTRNSVGDNSTTGEVRISDNAFQNLSGLSVLNVNTGNNVAINASMNVNISLPAIP